MADIARALDWFGLELTGADLVGQAHNLGIPNQETLTGNPNLPIATLYKFDGTEVDGATFAQDVAG